MLRHDPNMYRESAISSHAAREMGRCVRVQGGCRPRCPFTEMTSPLGRSQLWGEDGSQVGP